MRQQRAGLSGKPGGSGGYVASRSLPVPSEESEQVAVAGYLDLLFGGRGWFHPPNGGLRNQIVAKKLKGQGVKAGIPDIMIYEKPWAGQTCRGLAIELKRLKGGVVSREQEDKIEDLKRNGWDVYVAEGASEAIAIIEMYFPMKMRSERPR